MGTRGPGAKPVALRVLEGTSGQVLTFPEPEGAAERPEWLNADAARIWDRIVSSFPPNYFKAADEQQLAGYCTACSRQAKAQKEIEAGSEVVDGRKSPWLKVQEDAQKLMATLGSSLGIGPAKRTVSVAASAKSKRDGLMYRRAPTA